MRRDKQPRFDRRAVVAGALAAASFAGPALSLQRYDSVVGEGGFATVQAALDAAPSAATRPHRILVRRGRWYEKLTIDKPNIHLIGEDRAGSVLYFDAAAGLPGPNGSPYGTFRSASVTITAPDCALINVTVDNTFDYVGARENPEENPAGNGLQAVALALLGDADRTLVEDVRMSSWQDTLLTNAGRSLFRNCRIAGAVDYIFGAGTAYFEDCEIETLGRPGSEGARLGYITAPSTQISNPYGLVFDNCRLSKMPGMREGVIALGRPWRPTTNFEDGRYGNPDAVGQAVFLNCWMDDHIDTSGWDSMGYNAKGGGRASFEPQYARFFEFESRGPGGVVTPSRRQLTQEQARFFDRRRVLGDWRI